MTADSAELSAADKIDIDRFNLTSNGPLNLHAPDIDISINGSGNEQIFVNANGFDQGPADWVSIDVSNTDKLHIGELLTGDGNIKSSSSLLIDYAEVNGQLDMRTRDLYVKLNNTATEALAADAQMITPYDKFWIDMDGQTIISNGQFSRYNSAVNLFYQGFRGEYGIEEDRTYARLSVDYQVNTALQLEDVLPVRPNLAWLDRIFNLENIIGRVRAFASDFSDVDGFEFEQEEGESISLDDVISFNQEGEQENIRES